MLKLTSKQEGQNCSCECYTFSWVKNESIWLHLGNKRRIKIGLTEGQGSLMKGVRKMFPLGIFYGSWISWHLLGLKSPSFSFFHLGTVRTGGCHREWLLVAQWFLLQIVFISLLIGLNLGSLSLLCKWRRERSSKRKRNFPQIEQVVSGKGLKWTCVLTPGLVCFNHVNSQPLIFLNIHQGSLVNITRDRT